MQDLLLTVLMPVYNGEKFLQQCIDSILQQTLKDFEFLIIDDGSTDSSAGIIRSYKDPRIRFIQNEKNIGISATLNKGIDMSTTEYIARMDADDISYPERLQRQFEYLQFDKDCVLLSTSVRVVSKDGEFVRIDKYPMQYYYYNLNFICWIYHSSVMYRRSVVIDAGKYNVLYSEDFNLWWKITRKYKIFHLQEVLLDYRESAESLSAVLKRNEYENAQHEQVIRNIQYYTGPNFELAYNEVECFRHKFTCLLRENNVNAIIRCIKKLDYISMCILTAKNINKNEITIREATYYKKEFILNFFYVALPLTKFAWLLIRTKKINYRFIRNFKLILQERFKIRHKNKSFYFSNLTSLAKSKQL